MSRKTTIEEFVEKASMIHHNKYDYSAISYNSLKDNIYIICPIHGKYYQRAGNHLIGFGCSKCSGKSKYTTDEYIIKAKKVHGEKYDYSKVNYENAKKSIEIICRLHGPFYQIPSNHLNGAGCPACGGSKKRNTSTFIERAKEVFGDRYDYSDSIYINSNTKIKIICKRHDEFYQTPAHHLKGKECRKCSYEKRGIKSSMTLGQFLLRAKTIHGDKYNYEKKEWKNANTEVIIQCPKHGLFYQLPVVHLRGAGCPKCGVEYVSQQRKKNNEVFTAQARLVHGAIYDYQKVNYLNARENVIITCKLHGDFLQTPDAHLCGASCNKCADIIRADKKRLTINDYIIRARIIHGDKYDYSKTDYTSMNDEITIICSEHGPFKQRPGNHLNGNGCPLCANSGIKMEAPGIMYYLRIQHENLFFWKIGITNRTIEQRFMKDVKKIEVVKTWYYERMIDGYKEEQKILKEFKAYRVTQYLGVLSRGGNTELFIDNVLGIE